MEDDWNEAQVGVEKKKNPPLCKREEGKRFDRGWEDIDVCVLKKRMRLSDREWAVSNRGIMCMNYIILYYIMFKMCTHSAVCVCICAWVDVLSQDFKFIEAYMRFNGI